MVLGSYEYKVICNFKQRTVESPIIEINGSSELKLKYKNIKKDAS